MNKIVFLCCGLLPLSLHAIPFEMPQAVLYFKEPVPQYVYLGESIRIPIKMDHSNLRKHIFWTFPPRTTLEQEQGICPSFIDTMQKYDDGSCDLALRINGNKLGTIFGAVSLNVFNTVEDLPFEDTWNFLFSSPMIDVSIIPNPMYLRKVATQKATINQPFVFNLKSLIEFYDQNAAAGIVPQLDVSPKNLHGIYYDAERLSLVGIPNQIATLKFTINLIDNNGKIDSKDILIKVGAHKSYAPQYKQHETIPSAVPGQEYKINLLNLIENSSKTNQISFRFYGINPDFLDIKSNETIRLQGIIPQNFPSDELLCTLIASSNTGGDASPITIHIPIATDSSQAPFVQYFKIKAKSRTHFKENLAAYVVDNNQDKSLKILLDQVEPSAPWLTLSGNTLHGNIPDYAVDRNFRMTIRANTKIGGSSAPIYADLYIESNKKNRI